MRARGAREEGVNALRSGSLAGGHFAEPLTCCTCLLGDFHAYCEVVYAIRA